MKVNPFTVGPIVGETTGTSVRLWGRGGLEFVQSRPRRVFGVAQLRRNGDADYMPPKYFKLNPNFDLTGVVVFNNLNPDFMPLCVQAMMVAVEKICPDTHSLLLIPENHTRNIFYLQNVAVLQTILRHTGMNVRVGTLLPEISKASTIDLPNGNSLMLEPVQREGNRLVLENFDPCAVLLNNDLSTGAPDILQNLETWHSFSRRSGNSDCAEDVKYGVVVLGRKCTQ